MRLRGATCCRTGSPSIGVESESESKLRSVLRSAKSCCRTSDRARQLSFHLLNRQAVKRRSLCCSRCAAWCLALRSALRRRRELIFAGASDGASGARCVEVAAALPEVFPAGGGCGRAAIRPKRRAVARAFLSVERSCSSLNSFWAAKVDASSTDHGTNARRRPANDAMGPLQPRTPVTNNHGHLSVTQDREFEQLSAGG